MSNNVMREITPLTPGDCFTIFSRVKQRFDFPLHYHDEYELSLILNAKGAKRVIGGHIEVIDDLELVLIGPNVYHTWFTHQCQSESITEITYKCGFNNISNFNRIFKRKKLCIPKEFRETYTGNRVFI